ncbi:hypothetical protein FKP32DRAFT_1674976 [Trametes sanguinea]|nr:hypothetical protein FKP32DRAFT_1674976 [Trametes sanguinea]
MEVHDNEAESQGDSQEPGGNSTGPGLSKKASSLLESLLAAARDETNKNFRPPSREASQAKVTTRGKNSGKARDQQQAQRSEARGSSGSQVTSRRASQTQRHTSGSTRRGNRGLFRVSKIVFLPYGVDGTGELPDYWAKTPRKTRIQELQQFGLAVLGGEAEGEQLWLDERWSVTELCTFLKEMFPPLFRYLAAEDPVLAGLSSNAKTVLDPDYRLPYVLLVSEAKKLAVVPGNRNPDGALCRFNKGRDSAGWRESNIFLAARRSISPTVYTKWSPAFKTSSSRFTLPLKTATPESPQIHNNSLIQSSPAASGCPLSDDNDQISDNAVNLRASKPPAKVQYHSQTALSHRKASGSRTESRKPSERKGKGKALATILEDSPSRTPSLRALSKRKRMENLFDSDLDQDDSTDEDIERGFSTLPTSSDGGFGADPSDRPSPSKRRRIVLSPEPAAALHIPGNQRHSRSVTPPAAAASSPSPTTIQSPASAVFTSEHGLVAGSSRAVNMPDLLVDIIDLTGGESDGTADTIRAVPSASGASGASSGTTVDGLSTGNVSALPQFGTPHRTASEQRGTHSDDDVPVGIMSSPAATRTNTYNPWDVGRKPKFCLDF